MYAYSRWGCILSAFGMSVDVLNVLVADDRRLEATHVEMKQLAYTAK